METPPRLDPAGPLRTVDSGRAKSGDIALLVGFGGRIDLERDGSARDNPRPVAVRSLHSPSGLPSFRPSPGGWIHSPFGDKGPETVYSATPGAVRIQQGRTKLLSLKIFALKKKHFLYLDDLKLF